MTNNIIKRMFLKKSSQVCNFVQLLRTKTDGVAAVEFAFIAPIMIVMYIGTLEVSNAVSANKKLSRSAYIIGDLVTQNSSIGSNSGCMAKADLDSIANIAENIMYPYEHDVQISLTGIDIDSGNRVIWSHGYKGGTAYAVNSLFTDLPSQIESSGGFVVASQVNMNYTPYFAFVGYGGTSGEITTDTSAIPMAAEFYLRPRLSDTLEIKTSC